MSTYTIEGESNDAAAIIDSTRELTIAAAEPFEVDLAAPSVYLLRTPKADGSWELEEVDLEGYAPAPRRKKGARSFTTTESLARYLQTHRSDGTTLYADPDALTVVAVIDDHSALVPGHTDHRATLTLRKTPGAERWLGAHAKYLEQEAFAQLIEDGLTEIASPPGAELLEVAQSIRATKSAAFRSDRRLTSGRVQFSWVEELDARAGENGDLTIPELVTLVFEPFYGADPIQIDARFRYRIQSGKLSLGFWLIRHEEAMRAAFGTELERLAELTTNDDVDGLVALWGSPYGARATVG